MLRRKAAADAAEQRRKDIKRMAREDEMKKGKESAAAMHKRRSKLYERIPCL